MDFLDLGFLDYKSACLCQIELHEKRQKDKIPDTLILVEHPHVITLGRNTKKGDIVKRERLELMGVPVIEIDRGGGATYHGPGQIVVYPIFNLRLYKKDIRFYLEMLEKVIIELLHIYQIKARGNYLTRGIWVNNKKIASIGIAISKWITYHGLALNINPDMSFFSYISPCGLSSDKMMSMQEALGCPLDKQKIKNELAGIFKKLFNDSLLSKN